MAALTLLPLGTLQLLAAIEHGYWYARSAEFMQQPIVELLVWMRMPGDILFSMGAVTLTWFVLRLWFGPRREETALPVRRRGGRALRRPPRMIEFYAEIRQAHIAAAIASGAVPAAGNPGTGAAAQVGARAAAALPQLHDRHGPADRRPDACSRSCLAAFLFEWLA